MSMLAMAGPSPHHNFGRDFAAWDGGRPADHVPRPRLEASERIALPSIRQAIPELQMRVQSQESGARAAPTSTSPSVPLAGMTTPPEYVHSPVSNKRRRLSDEGDVEGERARRIPRLYASPNATTSRQPSPPMPPRSANESWPSASWASPYSASAPPPPPPPMHSAHSADVNERGERFGARQALPSLPSMGLADRDEARLPPRARGHSSDDYTALRPPAAPQGGPSGFEPLPSFRGNSFTYGYHHPNRMQSLSVGAAHAFERTPFSASPGYGAPFHQEFVRIGDFGAMGLSADNKQRKRRGNLPKETTDKLRAWFVAHLHHPYPTEDEKQDLMRQTGLQMNQISNWFINARRRQLPTMINNARVESDATAGRGGEGKILASTERHLDMLPVKRSSVPLSEGDGATFEDELEAMDRRRAAQIKRGSV